MGLIKDIPDWLLERCEGDLTCRCCGEREATILWDGMVRPADGLLLLCDECVLSMGGGMLNDLVLDGTASLAEVYMQLEERLRRTIELRLENVGQGISEETADRYRKILQDMQEH